MEELTATQIGARLGVSERTAQRYIKSGKLKATLQANGYYLVDPADIDALKPPTLPTVTTSASALADIETRLAQLEERIGHLEGIVGVFIPQTSPLSGTSQQTTPVLSQPQGGTSTLPEGAILLFQFARNHGVNESSIKNQARSKRFVYSERVKPNRPTEHDKFLTREQQKAVIVFWQRNGTPFIRCERCPHE